MNNNTTQLHSATQESMLLARLNEISKNSNVANSIMDDIKISVSRYNLDLEKICGKLSDVLSQYTEFTNVRGLVMKVVHSIAFSPERSAYEKKWKYPAFLSLHEALKKAGITGPLADLFFIDAIEEHCLNEFAIDINELIWTNKAIIQYCQNNNKNTYADFIICLTKSRLLTKCNVPYELLQKKAKEQAERCEKLEKELEDFECTEEERLERIEKEIEEF